MISMNHSVAPRNEDEFTGVCDMINNVNSSMDTMMNHFRALRALQQDKIYNETIHEALRQQYNEKLQLLQVLEDENLKLKQEVIQLNKQSEE